jgi:hypothetical protein
MPTKSIEPSNMSSGFGSTVLPPTMTLLEFEIEPAEPDVE